MYVKTRIKNANFKNIRVIIIKCKIFLIAYYINYLKFLYNAYSYIKLMY